MLRNLGFQPIITAVQKFIVKHQKEWLPSAQKDQRLKAKLVIPRDLYPTTGGISVWQQITINTFQE